MLCSACGTDNMDGRLICVECGARLRAGVVDVRADAIHETTPVGFDTWPNGISDGQLRDIDWSEIELDLRDDRSDTTLWPAESVFAPTADPAPEPGVQDPPPPPEAVFEDAQADDIFEQSLSGVKLEDLVDDEAQPEAAAEVPPPAPPAPAFDAPVAEAAVPETAALGAEPFVPEPEVRKASRFKRFLKVAAMVVVPVAAFAAGAASGVWFVERTRPPAIVQVAEVAPAPETPRPPEPPAGMALVPGGEFMMGSETGDRLSKPPHAVTVKPFFMDVTEVTNEAYSEFVVATGHAAPLTWKEGKFPEGRAELPVTGVTWYDALEYAAWAGKRLPTEAEWEFAARGTDGRIYPWGSDWDEANANVAGLSKGLRPVGQGARSPFGLYDMAGNAWEWTSSDARPYPGGTEFKWSKLRLKIIRGGNWQSDSVTAASTFRGFYGASGEREYNSTSFRCVKDIPNDRKVD